MSLLISFPYSFQWPQINHCHDIFQDICLDRWCHSEFGMIPGMTSPDPQSGSFKHSRLQTFLYFILHHVSPTTCDVPGHGRARPHVIWIQQQAYKTITIHHDARPLACFSLVRLSFWDRGPTQPTPITLKTKRTAHTGGKGRRGLLYVSKRQLAGEAVHVHEGEDPNMKILYVQNILIVHAVSQFQDSSSTSEMKFW